MLTVIVQAVNASSKKRPYQKTPFLMGKLGIAHVAVGKGPCPNWFWPRREKGGTDLPQKFYWDYWVMMMISLRHASPNPRYEVVCSVEMSGNAVAFGLGGVHLVATNTYRSDPILATTLIVLLMPPHIKAALIWSLYHAHHYSVDVSLWSRVLSYHDQGHHQSLTLWITTIFDCSCPPANTTCIQRITLMNWQPFYRLIENQTNHHFIHCPKPATECFTSDTLY